MKQFLRHISLLLALFMATTSAWAECYLYENKSITIEYDDNDHNDSGTFSSTEYSLVDDNGVFIGGTMTFKYDLSGGTNASYWHKLTIQGYTGSTWQDIWDTGDIYNKDSKTANIGDISSWKNYSKIRFKRTAKKASLSSWSKGERDINVTSLYITRLTSISPTSASHTFDPITVGESTPTYDFTFDYSNVGTNFVVSSKKSSPHFSIEYIGDAPNACEGSAKYRVTYNPQFGGSHDEIYTITCKDGDVVKGTVIISVTGSAKGYPQHTWYGKDTYNVDDAAIDLDDIWDSNNEEFNTITYSIPETDGFVPSGTNNEGAVKPYIDADNKLYLGQAGTLHLVMHQIATDGFYEKTSTKTITINKYNVEASISQSTAVWNEIIDNPFSLSYGLIDFDVESKNTNIAEYHKDTKRIQTYFTDGTASFQITRPEDYKYNALSKTLTLDVNKSIVNCPVLEDSDQRNWETIDNSGTYTIPSGTPDSLFFQARRTDILGFTNTTEFYAEYSSDNNTWTEAMTINLPDQGTWYDLKCDIPETAKYVRFITYTGATGNKHIRNVCVTRKNYLRPSVSSLALPQTTIGKPVSASFDLNWSTCSDEIVLLSTNRNFVLSKSSIDATSGRGTTTITATYDANSGSQSGTIIIYDQSQKIEIPVSCEVKAKLATEIIYTGEATYPETLDGIPYPFYVKDENGNTVQGAEITLATSKEDILSFDDTKIYPHCGGPVTLTANYAGDEIYAPAEWSRVITVANCYQTIDWDQDFRQYIAAEDGTINQTTPLTAVAVPTNFDITYELDESAQKFAKIENGSLVIFGIGTGHIIASAPSGTYETKYYDAASLKHEIRVRKWGDKCNTDESVASDEITLSALFSWFYDDEEVIGLDGRPYERMEFYSHVSSGSGKNELTVSFSADGGATWSNSQTYTIPETYDWNTPYIHANVPEGANQVKFKTTSTGMTYFNMVKMVQESYLRAKDMDGNNLDKIVVEDAIVNEPFSRTFTVEYSDVPLIQYSVTDSHDLGLKLEPNPTISNDCGDWGTYTFTLKGESPYPQSGVIEKIRLYTSAGDEVVIPITITATLSEPFFFNVQDGDWNESTKWTHKGSTTHGMVPDKRFPVVVSKALQIGNESTSCKAVAYNVTIEGEGNVKIGSKGGLTLHAGGFAEGVTNDNFTIENNQDGVGYVRVSPYFINKVSGEMPNITVQYTTRAKAGGAKDQVWQYVGAPGNNMQMSNDGVMVYLWSETDGWVYSNTNMTPFEGYALTRTAEGAETYSIVAQPIHDNKTINLTKTANGMNGDNLFVNSYLAPIDLTKFTTDGEDSDFTGNVEKTFYLFNSGSWNDWQGENGEGANNILKGESAGKYHPITPLGAALIDANKDQTTIPPMQGVYVVANGDAQIHLKYNKHVFRSTSSDMNRPMRAPQIEDENFMRVRMQVNSQNSGADRMYVIQYENTTRGYDNGYDAKNIIAQGQANIYTNEPEGQMEISIADQIDSTFIGFAAGEDSEYTLTFTSLVGQDMYLHDLESDSLFLITEEGQYTFSAHPNSVNDMRFQLLLYPDFSDDLPGNGVTTGIDNLVSSAQVWVNDKRVYIADAPQNSKLVVYTANGMCITSPLTIHHTPCTIDLSHLPTGVYVLRLNNQAYKFVCK